MTRTAIDLDPTVLRQLRRRSREECKSIAAIASELLAQGWLRVRRARQQRRPLGRAGILASLGSTSKTRRQCAWPSRWCVTLDTNIPLDIRDSGDIFRGQT